MNSTSYWNVAIAVKDEVDGIAAVGAAMYGALEDNDDPAELADFLEGIEKRMTRLLAQVSPNIPALRKVAKALADVPGVES